MSAKEFLLKFVCNLSDYYRYHETKEIVEKFIEDNKELFINDEKDVTIKILDHEFELDDIEVEYSEITIRLR